MLASAARIRDQQRKIWDEFSAGWNKWDAELLGWQAPFGDALLEELPLRRDSWVLDVAAGWGNRDSLWPRESRRAGWSWPTSRRGCSAWPRRRPRPGA